jgi:signal transduction histidine kinase
MRLHDIRHLSLFDGFSNEALLQLLEASQEVRFSAGETLWTEGKPADYWWVLLEGDVDLVRVAGREETVVGSFDAPGRWAGGFRAWDDHGAYLATGRTTSSGRMLRVPAAALRDLLAGYPLVSHLIDGLFHTARNIEALARQREALVALGRLSAGLAHEINNPASAATRAVDALEEACQALLSSLRRMAEGEVSADQFTALDRLRHEITPNGELSPLRLADLEDDLSDWLDEHDVERGWVIAPALAAGGVDAAWCERVASVLPSAALEPGLEWVASTLSVTGLLAEVKESTNRVSNLVAAVKSYTQMDRASMQRVTVTDGLESTLVMLGHKLRDGITVVRDYGSDVPVVEGYAGELNQVWTNLIDNAVDAMDGSGTLRITARSEGDEVVVEIGDSGPGMSDEVAARAFEPFFTTKATGKGTGLGLDIARRIVVEHHHGTIGITSSAVDDVIRTVIKVSIPVRRRAPH